MAGNILKNYSVFQEVEKPSFCHVFTKPNTRGCLCFHVCGYKCFWNEL